MSIDNIKGTVVYEYNTERRKKNRRPPITVYIACTDDYGNMIAKCQWTGELFDVSLGIVRGSLMAQANVAYLDGPNSENAYRYGAALFHELEANCNMCKHLERVNSEYPGYLYGRCTSQARDIDKMPYKPDTQGVFMLSPDDHFGMPCWESR